MQADFAIGLVRLLPSWWDAIGLVQLLPSWREDQQLDLHCGRNGPGQKQLISGIAAAIQAVAAYIECEVMVFTMT